MDNKFSTLLMSSFAPHQNDGIYKNHIIKTNKVYDWSIVVHSVDQNYTLLRWQYEKTSTFFLRTKDINILTVTRVHLRDRCNKTGQILINNL